MTPPSSIFTDNRTLIAFEEKTSRPSPESLTVWHAKIDQIAPINALPIEIILCIFKFVVDTEKPKAPSLGWIRTVTHVCQLWRDAALASTILWSKICTDIGPRWTEEMFRRASSTLLDIHSNASYEIADRLVSRHLQSPNTMSIVRSLDLSISCDIIQDIRVPAPSLYRLTVSTPHYQTPDWIVTLPPDLFAYHAPKLRSARLLGCRIPWESPIFNESLKLLAFGPGYIRGQAADVLPSPSQLYGLLKRTPLLEVFHGLVWLPPIVSAPHLLTAGDDPIQLTRLKKIVVAGHIADCLQFLRCIMFPASATVSLTCVRSLNNTLSLHDIIPFLVDRFKHPDYTNLPIRKLAITYPPNQKQLGISLLVSSPNSQSSTCRKLHQAFMLELVFPQTSKMLDFLKVVCRTLPFQHVVDLLVDLSGCESAASTDSFWIDHFYEMQNVRHLEVSVSVTSSIPLLSVKNQISLDISRAFDTEQPTSSPEDEQANSASTVLPIFPALQSLFFSRVQLPDVWDEDVFIQFFQKLILVVDLRKTWGVPLRELKVVLRGSDTSLPEGFLNSWTFRAVKARMSQSVSKVRFDYENAL